MFSLIEMLMLGAVVWCLWRVGRQHHRVVVPADDLRRVVLSTPTPRRRGGLLLLFLTGLVMATVVGIGTAVIWSLRMSQSHRYTMHDHAGTQVDGHVQVGPVTVDFEQLRAAYESHAATEVIPDQLVTSPQPIEGVAVERVAEDVAEAAEGTVASTSEATAVPGVREDPLAQDGSVPDPLANPASPSLPEPPASPLPPAADVPEKLAPPSVQAEVDAMPPTDSLGGAARPEWLDGKYPDQPHTHYRVVPTATFALRERAQEAVVSEAQQALMDLAKQVVEELHIPSDYAARFVPAAGQIERVLQDQFIEPLEEGTYRGHALLAISPDLRHEVTQGVTETLVLKRLRGAGLGTTVVLGGLLVFYGLLRCVGGRPQLFADGGR